MGLFGRVQGAASLEGKLSLSLGILVKLGGSELGFRIWFHFWRVLLKPRGTDVVSTLLVTSQQCWEPEGMFLI